MSALPLKADIPTALSSPSWQVTIDLITEALITIADEDNPVPPITM
jgi:hypothetical protein